MLKGREHVSDLIFSPGHAPQVELSGELVELPFRGLERLLPAHTSADRPGSDRVERATPLNDSNGRLGGSFLLGAQVARFRVNIFRQRGTYAIVMRVIPTTHSDVRRAASCPQRSAKS